MGWKWLWRIGHSSWVASRKLFLGRLLIDQVIYSWGLGFFVVFHIIRMVNRFDQFEMQACLGFKLQTLCVGIPANLRNSQISHYQLSIWFALYGHTGQWLTPKLIADNYRPIHHSNLLFSLFPVSVVFGSYLNINKATKLDMGAYLCVANNSIPAAISKRVWLGVTCKFAFSFWLDGIRQIRNIQGATTTTAGIRINKAELRWAIRSEVLSNVLGLEVSGLVSYSQALSKMTQFSLVWQIIK